MSVAVAVASARQSTEQPLLFLAPGLGLDGAMRSLGKWFGVVLIVYRSVGAATG